MSILPIPKNIRGTDEFRELQKQFEEAQNLLNKQEEENLSKYNARSREIDKKIKDTEKYFSSRNDAFSNELESRLENADFYFKSKENALLQREKELSDFSKLLASNASIDHGEIAPKPGLKSSQEIQFKNVVVLIVGGILVYMIVKKRVF